MLTPGVMWILAEQHYSLFSLFRRYSDENPILSPEQSHAHHGHDAIGNTQQFSEMSPAAFVLMASDFNLQQRLEMGPNHSTHPQFTPNPNPDIPQPNANPKGKTAKTVSDVLLLNPDARALHFNAFVECLLVTAWRAQLRSSHPTPVCDCASTKNKKKNAVFSLALVLNTRASLVHMFTCRLSRHWSSCFT